MSQVLIAMWFLVLVITSVTYAMDSPDFRWKGGMGASILMTSASMVVLRGRPVADGEVSGGVPWLRWSLMLTVLVFIGTAVLTWAALGSTAVEGVAAGLGAALSALVLSSALSMCVALMRKWGSATHSR